MCHVWLCCDVLYCVVLGLIVYCVVLFYFEKDSFGDAGNARQEEYKQKLLAHEYAALFCAFVAVTGTAVECWANDSTFARQEDRLPHYEHPLPPHTTKFIQSKSHH